MRSLLLLAVSLAAFTAGLSPSAFARAGGGESYSSGGGGSWSGSGSSSSGGWSSSGSSSWGSSSRYRSSGGSSDDVIIPFSNDQLMWLMLFIGIILLWAYLQQYGGRLGGAMIAQAAQKQEADRLRAALDALLARDPLFSQAAFLKRIESAFLKIQYAWSAHDLRPVRPFVTDGVFERFSLQIEMQKARGIRNETREVVVLAAEILEVESDASFDTVHVSIKAQARDVDVSLKDGSLARDGGTDSFEEVWSFIRRPGAATLNKPGLIEGACPNCGQSLEAADSATCPSCKTWMQSGEYDWLLAEITQACEWAVREDFELPGLAEAMQGDPALSSQQLEDRVSAVFWRLTYAMFTRALGPVKAVGSPDWLANVSEDLKKDSMENVAVGKVELVCLEPGGPKDRAHVAVKWSGRLPGSGDASVQTTVFSLERARGAVTGKAGLRTLACAGCGAAPSTRDAEKCPYCALPFNDGSRYWIVTDAVPYSRWQNPAARPGPEPRWTTSLSSHDAVATLVLAMTSDRRVDPKELSFVRSFADAHGVSRSELGELVRASESGKLALPQANDPEMAEQVLIGLMRMSLSDGEMSPAELSLIENFASRFGMAPDQVRQMLQEQKVSLFENAKESLSSRA